MMRAKGPGSEARWTRVARSVVGDRLARNGAMSLAGFVAPTFALLVFTPVLIHQAGPANYGLWIVGTSFLGTLSGFDFGLSTAIGKYVAEYRAAQDVRRMSETVTTGTLLYMTIGVVLTIGSFAFAPTVASLFDGQGASHSAVTSVLRVSTLGLLPMLLKNAAFAVPIGFQRFGAPAALSAAQTIAALGAASVAALLHASPALIVATTVVVAWIVAMIAWFNAIAMLRGAGATARFSFDQLKVVGKFLFFTGGSALGHVLFASVDRLVVGAVLSVAAVAYYSISIAIAVNLLAAADMLTRPLMPAASDWARRGEWGAIRACLGRVTAGVAAVELTVGAALIFFARPLLTLWLGAGFASHGTTPFRIFVGVFAVAAIGAPAFHIVNGIGRPWIAAVGGVTGGALTILLIVVLAPRWGVVGAAVSNFAGLTALLPLVYLAWRLRASGPQGVAVLSDPSHA